MTYLKLISAPTIVTPRYIFKELISEDDRSQFYIGIDTSTNTSIDIVQLKRTTTIAERMMFQKIHHTLQALNVPGTVEVIEVLDTFEGSPAVILKKVPGISLEAYTSKKHLPLADILSIIAQITVILGDLHTRDRSLVHGNLRPQSISIDPKTRQVTVIDFGHPLNFSLEHSHDLLHTTIDHVRAHYIAPEQTGKWDRSIDHRADLYSLGIIFFELLTGVLPYRNTDLLSSIHAHIAQEPIDPQSLAPEIPDVLKKIVLKLLAKNPEERYQTAAGLNRDLSICVDQLRSSQVISDFSIATHDVPLKFNISQKLYGRDTELLQLQDIFSTIMKTGTPSLVMLTGASGTGKSMMRVPFQQWIVHGRGTLISGKYDQYRSEPYGALLWAIRSYIVQLHHAPRHRIDLIKKNLDHFENGLSILVNVIPELATLLGNKAPHRELAHDTTKTMFNFYILKLLQGLITKDHPVVLFLDDLQWADEASIDLIRILINDPGSHHLMIIGTLRTAESTSETHHPLLDPQKVASVQIPMRDLELAETICFVADSMHNGIIDEQVRNAAELIQKKTLGNPYHSNKLMRTLYEQDILYLGDSGRWEFDIRALRGLPVADNVVHIIVEKLITLPGSLKDTLEVCACIGDRFTLEELVNITGNTHEHIYGTLSQAIDEGLISNHQDEFRFFHDQVRDTLYTHIQAEKRRAIHAAIGRYYAALISEDPDRFIDDVIPAAHHLYQGRELLSSEVDRRLMLTMNHKAAIRSKSLMDLARAYTFYTNTIALLPDSAWETDHRNTLTIYEEAILNACMLTDIEEVERLSRIALTHTPDILDQIPIHTYNIMVRTINKRFKEAVEYGLTQVRKLGISIPGHPSKLRLAYTLIQGKRFFTKKVLDTISKNPLMTDRKQLAIIELLSTIGTAAYIAEPTVMVLITTEALHLSYQHGITYFTPLVLSAFAMIMGHVFNDIDRANLCGRTANNVSRIVPTEMAQWRGLLGYNDFTRIYHDHREHVAAFFREYVQKALRLGDTEYFEYAVNLFAINSFPASHDLRSVRQDLEEHQDLALKVGVDYAHNRIYQQLIDILTHGSSTPDLLEGSIYNERTALPFYQGKKDFHVIINTYLAKQILAYFFGLFDQGLVHCLQIKQVLKKESLLAPDIMPTMFFFDALNALDAYRTAHILKKLRLRVRIKRDLNTLERYARTAPMNFGHCVDLIRAELAALHGAPFEAARLFDQAIQRAHDDGYPMNEAIAYERAGKFFLANTWVDKAIDYLTTAAIRYDQWGASAKVEQMLQTYPDIQRSAISLPHAQAHDRTLSNLDLLTIYEESLMLSEKMELETLFQNFLDLSMKNLGAQYGYLAVKNGSRWRLVLKAESTDQGIKITPLTLSLPDAAHIVPLTLIDHVRDHDEHVIIHDNSREGLFADDPYITAKQPRSILCMPVKGSGETIGVLYHENNLIPGAFSSHQMAAQTILTSRAATSINNALLYAEQKRLNTELSEVNKDLNYKVWERTEELQQANEELEQSNEELITTNDELLEANKKLKKMQEAYEIDMSIAGTFQNKYFPEYPPHNEQWDVAFMKTSYLGVSGDLYDFYMADRTLQGVSIFDVAGHGLSAGLITMLARPIIYHNFNDHINEDLGIMMTSLHGELVRVMFELNHYLTGVIVRFQEDHIEYVNAGHPDIIIKRAATGKIDIPQLDENSFLPMLGMPGIKPSQGYAQKIVPIAPGDTIILFTDGLIEKIDRPSREDGMWFLRDALEKTPPSATADEIKELLWADLVANAHDAEQIKDDVTLMVLKKK